MGDYRTYLNKKGEEFEFVVFIIHGHSEDWRKVERYINKKLDFNTIVLKENYRAGETIIDKLENAVDQCECAIAILSQDDLMKNETVHARQNVIFELGYCQGIYDRKKVIILKEESVEINSDLNGLVYIGYESGSIDATFPQIAEGLEEIYDSINYEEDEE